MKKHFYFLLFLFVIASGNLIAQEEDDEIYYEQDDNSYYNYYQNYDYRYQPGYFKNDGSYVMPHYKTNSNETNWDNNSTDGNYNFFTGEEGTRARDYSPEAYDYGEGRIIYTGPRGGQYYINDKGNKVYVPKR